MAVLVTGAAGHVGGTLVRALLAQGRTVRALVHRDRRALEGLDVKIIEWTGWAVMTWSPPGLAFAVWTFANLAPRAHSNHRWYREYLPGYPPTRKALAPGLW